MKPDHFLTLAGEAEAEVREKASRFIAHAFPIADEDDFKQRREAIAAKHHSARHICHAWVLGPAGDRFRAFDAGEPAGSAGKPILRQLQGAGLTQCAVVVVRYFGGTLLGKAGLAHAFADAAKESIARAGTTERLVLIPVEVRCSYAQLERVRHEVKQLGGEVLDSDLSETCLLKLALPTGAFDALRARWERMGITVQAVKG
jgi:uncharacterized YigZ family protein